MSTQRKTRNTSSSRGSGNGRGSGSNGRGSSGSSGRTIHGGSSATATPRTGKDVIPGLGGPNGQGFGNPPIGQTNDSTSGEYQGNWQTMLNLPVADLRYHYIDFLVKLLGEKHIPQELQTLMIQQLLQQGANAEQRSYDWQLTQDQRQYDWSLLQDNRIYNSPTNVLARLMGAGVSRDAAIQMLSGASAGSGAGVGSGSPVVSSPSQVPMSDTFGNQILNTTNTALNAINAFAGLVDLGFTVPQAFQQVKFMKNQNFLNGEQIKAYQLSSEAYNIIKSSGLDITDDVFSSVGNVGDFLTSLANDGNTAAQQFISSGGLDGLRSSSPYSSPMLAQLYKDERSARDYNEEFRNNMDLIRAQADLQKVNIDHLRADILQIDQNVKNLRASEQYTIAQTNLAKKTEELTGKQIELTGVQTLTEKETLYSLGLQNDLEDSWRNSTVSDGRSGLQLYSDYQLQRLYGDVMQLTTLNSKDAWTKQANSILASYENSIALYELGVLYAKGEIDTMIDSDQQTLDLLNFCRAAEKSGLFPYIQAVATGETAGHMNIGPVGMSEPSKRAQDIYVGIDERTNKRKKWRK